MPDYLKTLSAEQLERLIKKSVDNYLGREFAYTIKDLNTPNVNTDGDKITFEVEIKDEKT